MKNKFEGCVNFALLSSATAVSCLVILNTATKLVGSPDTLSSEEISFYENSNFPIKYQLSKHQG